MVSRIMFIAVFSIILFMIIYLPMNRLFTYFSLSYAWLASLLSVMVFPVGLLLSGMARNNFTYWLAQVTNGWFGALLALVSVVTLVELARVITKFQTPYAGWIIVGVWAVVVVASIICANLWTVKEITITSDKVTEEVTFVQLSDLHAYGTKAPANIKKVFDKAMKVNPDFIVVTGDMIDMPGKPPVDSFKVLDDIPVPIIYELGNHEAYVGLEYVRDMVRQSNLALIENGAIELNGITVISISDSEDKTHVERTLPTIGRDEEQFQVLLYHKPVEYKAASQNGIDLMLSGHTHAGQFFPVHVIVLLMYKYPWGTHDVDGMTLHTSSGSGTFTWPLRLFSTNQITKITIQPAN